METGLMCTVYSPSNRVDCTNGRVLWSLTNSLSNSMDGEGRGLGEQVWQDEVTDPSEYEKEMRTAKQGMVRNDERFERVAVIG